MEIWFHKCQFKMKEYRKTILIVQIIHYFSRKYIFDNYRTFYNFRAQNLHWKLHKIYRIYVTFVKSIYAFIKKVYVLSRIMFLSNFQPWHTMSGRRNFWTLQKNTLDKFYVKFTKLTIYFSDFHFTHCTYVVTLL